MIGVDQAPIAVRAVSAVWQDDLTARLVVPRSVLRNRIRSMLAHRSLQKKVQAPRTYIEALWRDVLGTEPVKLDKYTIDLWEFKRRLLALAKPYPVPEQHIVVINGQQMPSEFYWLLRLLGVTATVFVDAAAHVDDDGTTVEQLSRALGAEPHQIGQHQPDTTRQIYAVARAFLAPNSMAATVPPERSGPVPTLANHATPDGEIEAIERYVRTYPDKSVALLLPLGEMVDDYRDALEKSHVGQVEWYRTDRDAPPIDWSRPGVKVLTWSSALGLKFDTVIFAGLEQLDDDPPFPWLRNAMRTLAGTARRELILSYSGETEPAPLACLPRELFGDGTTNTSPELLPSPSVEVAEPVDIPLPEYLVPDVAEQPLTTATDESIAAARAVLASDRRRPASQRGSRILTGSEEVGLAYLMRGDEFDLADELPKAFRASLDPNAEQAQAFDALLAHNERLVRSITSKFTTIHLDVDDLYQEGVLGLIRAVEKFDATKGYKFSTYATQWIRQAVGRALPYDYGMKIPIHAYEEMKKVEATRRRLLNSRREASVAAISHECGLAQEAVGRYLQLLAGLVSLDARLPDSLDTTFADLIPLPDDHPDVPDRVLDRRTTAQLVHRGLGTLKPREAQVLRLRYGVGNDEPLILDRIGVQLGVTRERVRQIEAKAKPRLAKALADLAFDGRVAPATARPAPRSAHVNSVVSLKRSHADLASGGDLLGRFAQGQTPADAAAFIGALVEHGFAAGAQRVQIRSGQLGTVPWLALMHDGYEWLGTELRAALSPGSASEHKTQESARAALALAVRMFTEIIVWNAANLSRCLSLTSAPRTGNWWLADAEGQPPPLAKSTDVRRLQYAIFRGPQNHVRGLDLSAQLRRLSLRSALVSSTRVDQYGTVLTVEAEDSAGADPFLSRHPRSQDLGAEILFADGHVTVVNPWVLPYPDGLSPDDVRSAGDPSRWLTTQGFYLCCDGHYLVRGGWLGLPGLDSTPETSLARVALDIEPDGILAWGINGSAPTPNPPPALRSRLIALANLARERSRRVHSSHNAITESGSAGQRARKKGENDG
ncbi:RNA polymerase sigma factor RpoD/SigA [Salinispora arenicola]|uniref:sigma-70 family RNA polymerase sigma factor n=1 Tax=Salinispora arenicola TaxID=168697 RepID=UPI00037A7C92|nr:sigma-70 family RNA polymerase sigma factor [Salinispora arenicola]